MFLVDICLQKYKKVIVLPIFRWLYCPFAQYFLHLFIFFLVFLMFWRFLSENA